MDWVALLTTLLGVALLIVSALGLFRLPDALSRQHAATKSATLALWVVLLGVALHTRDFSFVWRIAVVVVVLLVTLPLASHQLARAAARHAYDEQRLKQVRRFDSSGQPD